MDDKTDTNHVNRREFLKQAGSLIIPGLSILGLSVSCYISNCHYSCTGDCVDTCRGDCSDTCSGDCSGTCDDSCIGTCVVICAETCSTSCVDGCSGGSA
ncbi:MAG: Cys-Xaa-Xaa-Xaa repeat radical SAM target protein [Spirochaetales bacterium]|nr:Cys-Xaa-Xaa-Xaa repeat radical SAM target protein [Spirochaetales bacterium]